MTAVIACGWILASLAWDRVKPISLDTLPPGAFARLGTARYDGQVRLSPDGKKIAVLPDCWKRNLYPCINIHDAESGKYLRTLHPPSGSVGTKQYPANPVLVCDQTAGHEHLVKRRNCGCILYLRH